MVCHFLLTHQISVVLCWISKTWMGVLVCRLNEWIFICLYHVHGVIKTTSHISCIWLYRTYSTFALISPCQLHNCMCVCEKLLYELYVIWFLSLFFRDIRLNPYAAGFWQLYQNLTAIDSYSSNETTRLSGLNGENRTRFFTMQFALNCTTHCMSIIVPIVHSTIRTTCNFSQFEVWRWHFLVFLLKFLATN